MVCEEPYGMRVSWVVQQVIPPALLTYFAVAGKICITEIGPYIGDKLAPWIGALYSGIAITLVGSCTILYLRLYFLPSSQGVPPLHAPPLLYNRKETFECLSPTDAATALDARRKIAGWDTSADDIVGIREAGQEEAEGSIVLLDRCWRGKCQGAWKPPRTRHCGECGRCRMGFDHHCGLFANCLTAPHIPTFLSLLILTPLTILLLAGPITPLLLVRAHRAWSIAWTDPAMREWWDWKAGWIVCGGPVGRYVGALILGWKELDRISPDSIGRWQIGALAGVGAILGIICAGLGYTTATQIPRGILSVDRERAKSWMRAHGAILALEARGEVVPQKLKDALGRYADVHYFHIAGEIKELGPPMRPYDLGRTQNWELIMGEGWGWILPWNAMRRGMTQEQLMRWPISDEAVQKLRSATDDAMHR